MFAFPGRKKRGGSATVYLRKRKTGFHFTWGGGNVFVNSPFQMEKNDAKGGKEVLSS